MSKLDAWTAAADRVIALHDATLALGAERADLLEDPDRDPAEILRRLAEIDAQAQLVPKLRLVLLARRLATYRAYMSSLGSESSRTETVSPGTQERGKTGINGDNTLTR